MERVLSSDLHKVLVGGNTGSLESLRRDLLVLVGNEVDAEREVIDTGTLATKIEDLDLGVGHTTVEPRLGVRLVYQNLSLAFHSNRIATDPPLRRVIARIFEVDVLLQ